LITHNLFNIVCYFIFTSKFSVLEDSAHILAHRLLKRVFGLFAVEIATYRALIDTTAVISINADTWRVQLRFPD